MEHDVCIESWFPSLVNTASVYIEYLIGRSLRVLCSGSTVCHFKCVNQFLSRTESTPSAITVFIVDIRHHVTHHHVVVYVRAFVLYIENNFLVIFIGSPPDRAIFLRGGSIYQFISQFIYFGTTFDNVFISFVIQLYS